MAHFEAPCEGQVCKISGSWQKASGGQSSERDAPKTQLENGCSSDGNGSRSCEPNASHLAAQDICLQRERGGEGNWRLHLATESSAQATIPVQTDNCTA